MKDLFKIIGCCFVGLFIFTPQAFAKTITLDCSGTFYKYEKKIFRSPDVLVRSNADWQTWCKDNVSVSELGAVCRTQSTYEAGSNKTVHDYVTLEDVNEIRNELIKRYKFCKANPTKGICIPREGEKSNSLDVGAIIYEQQEPPGWLHKCDSFVGGRPTNEIKDFYMLPQYRYVQMHLPKLNDQKCSRNKFFVERVVPYTEEIYLDFLVRTKTSIGYSSGVKENTVESCIKIENR